LRNNAEPVFWANWCTIEILTLADGEFLEMTRLEFTPEMLTKRRHSALTVATKLAHFAIITYIVEPDVLRQYIHERFELDCIFLPDGRRKALVSVVPFLDREFHFVRCPWPKSTFGQTNYRAYVTDTTSGEHVAWFFGTSLASIAVGVPRFAWKLPWHHAEISFDTQYDEKAGRYLSYEMTTCSKWAPARDCP